MTRTFKQRAIFTITITVLTMVLGGVAGYLLGCIVVLNATSNFLATRANLSEAQVRGYINESFSTLIQLNEEQEALCTDQDLAQLRILVLNSQYIRDIGRIQNGLIQCSATQGRLAKPIPLPDNGRLETINGRVYFHGRHFPPMESPDWDNHGIQQGNSYVLLSNQTYAGISGNSIWLVRNAYMFSPERLQWVWGITPNIDRNLLNHDDTLIRNGSIFVTRCSEGRPSCSTVFTSIQTAMQQNRSLLGICMSAGGVIGLFLGFYSSLIYRRSLSLHRQLRRAIHRGEINLLYQPIVDLHTGRIIEAEALARWTDEDGFAISPQIFVATAESGGFITELTRLVTRRALKDLSDLKTCDPDFRVNINVTATDLADEGFLSMLDHALAESGARACDLAIEVTESSTVKAGTARETIRLLRERGHSVQIDDFGTGYSSLSYLDELSVDAIKIDRTFTKAISTKSVTASILPQILAMADTLNLLVIAEGIETPEQAAYFAGSERPIHGQGWLFGRPMKVEALCQELVLSHESSLR